MRKLVTNDWVHVFPGLALEDGGEGGVQFNLHILFLRGLLLGGSNAKNGVTIKRKNSL